MFDISIVCSSKHQQAREILAMYRKVRADQGGNKARSMARAELYATIVICNELNSLNEFAERYLPDSEISERILNPVFEDGFISDLALREIVRLADAYPLLARQIEMQEGMHILDQWRAKTRFYSVNKPEAQLPLFAGSAA